MLFFFAEFVGGLFEKFPEFYKGDNTARQEVKDFGRKWGWTQSIYGLAQHPMFRNVKDVTEINVHTALYWLSFEADKNRLEKQLMKRK